MSQPAEKIAAEIAAKGAVSFARFMELALYCPNYGYYERERDNLGRRGDYYTSVSVGRLFGDLLASQFADWLTEGDASAGAGARHLVEAGAHDGRLARDVLAWLRENRPALYQELEYWIVEPSERRRAWQAGALAEFAPIVHWATQLTELPSIPASSSGKLPAAPSVRGIIFSNELLDALPVHRLGWDAPKRIWFEWGVTLQGGRFVWARLAEPEIANSQLPISNDLYDVLPDGFTAEVNPAAEQWWRQAAGVLGRGRLVTLDYGLTAEELFMPERSQGTLRAYSQHRLGGDVLAAPGEQDLTAHVNFTAIQAAGESAGLRTEAFLTQAQFLTRIAARGWEGGASLGEWTPERTRQFQTLTHPQHLGQSFRVLVQSRR